MGGGTNERSGTDHVTSGPMRGLEKTAPNGTNGNTDRHPDMATLNLNRPSGADSVKTVKMHKNIIFFFPLLFHTYNIVPFV